jgi:hypothetical protein
MAPLDGQQLCWSSGHQNDPLEVGVPQYLGLAIPWYVYGPANLVGRPEWVCSSSPASLLWTPKSFTLE